MNKFKIKYIILPLKQITEASKYEESICEESEFIANINKEIYG